MAKEPYEKIAASKTEKMEINVLMDKMFKMNET